MRCESRHILNDTGKVVQCRENKYGDMEDVFDVSHQSDSRFRMWIWILEILLFIVVVTGQFSFWSCNDIQ